jgi:AcrR family transcriptional regulator
VKGTVDKRDSIIDAACAVLVEHGVAELAVTDVAARARVSAALVYYHFGTKQLLLAAAAERLATRRSASRSDALASTDGLAALDALWSALATGAGSDAERAWADLTLLARQDPAVRGTLDAARGAEQRALAERLPRVLTGLGSALQVPADEAAAVVLHFLDGIALALAGGAEGAELRAAYDAFWLVLVTAGQGRARRAGT